MVLLSLAGLFAPSPLESVCQSGHAKLWPGSLAYLESQSCVLSSYRKHALIPEQLPRLPAVKSQRVGGSSKIPSPHRRIAL